MEECVLCKNEWIFNNIIIEKRERVEKGKGGRFWDQRVYSLLREKERGSERERGRV